MAERNEESTPMLMDVGGRSFDHQRDDAVRELSRYLLNRPWVDPKALFGGLVHHEPHHVARLRALLEEDRATVARCLETLDALASSRD